MTYFVSNSNVDPTDGSDVSVPIPKELRNSLAPVIRGHDRDLPFQFFHLTRQGYTGIGEAVAAFHVGRLMDLLGRRVHLTQGRFLNWDHVDKQDLILLGGPHSNDWTYEKDAKSNFGIVGNFVVNAKPLPGEQARYAQDSNVDYALIQKLTTPYNFETLLLAGLSSAGTAAAGEFIANPNKMNSVYQTLRAGGENIPPDWEVLIRVAVRDGLPLETSVIAVRPLSPRRSPPVSAHYPEPGVRFYMAFAPIAAVFLAALLANHSCDNSTMAVREKPAATEPEATLHRQYPASFSDSAQDGTPDFLRLDTETDRATFRRWFRFLAEVQYLNPPGKRPAEIVDCSSLLRYCYREALRSHNSRWAADAKLPLVPAFGSVTKYNYPYPGMNGGLFRTCAGPFLRSNLRDGCFSQFASAETLERLNTFRVSRDVGAAQPGDLLFFKRQSGDERASYHSMIFLGQRQIRPAPSEYVVYDTGPEGARSGEVRLLSVSDLLHFPEPEWRPYASNGQFLGIYRWNILRDPT